MQSVRVACRFHSSRWLLFAIFVLAIYPQSAFAATKTITDADKGADVHIKLGDMLEVRLPGNPSTGYMWYVMPASTPILKLKSQSQTQPEEPGVGRPIFQIFNFQTRRSGSGLLQMHYVRSWEKPTENEEQFSIHIYIE